MSSTHFNKGPSHRLSAKVKNQLQSKTTLEEVEL